MSRLKDTKSQIKKLKVSKRFITSIIFEGVVIIELFIIANLVIRLVGPYTVSLFSDPAYIEAYKHTKSLENPPLFYPCMSIDTSRQPYTFLIPNCSTLFNGFDVELETTYIEINPDGYRGELYTEEKPENVYRIAVLGDSFTFGWGLNITETFPYILEQMLNNDSYEMEYQVLNLGVPRYSLEDNINNLENMGMRYDLNLVILTYFNNDVENNTRIREIYLNLVQNFPYPMDLNPDYASLFYLYYATNINYRELWSLDYSQFLENIRGLLERIRVMSDEAGFSVIIFFWDMPNERQSLMDYADEHNWTVVTADSIWYGYPLEMLQLNPPDLHPSALFNREVAKKLYDEIRRDILS